MQKILGSTQKAAIDGDRHELFDIFGLFYDVEPISFDIITTSRSDIDYREAVIAEFESGEKAVIKLADNDFTFPEKIEIWRWTAGSSVSIRSKPYRLHVSNVFPCRGRARPKRRICSPQYRDIQSLSHIHSSYILSFQ